MLISGATLMLELALLRLFAVQQFYHFAFMAVGLALLGAGASGSILSVMRRRFVPEGLSIGFGLSSIGAYLIINNIPFDSFSIAWDGSQLLYLAVYFLAAAVPFLFAGLLVGGALIEAGQPGGLGSHKVYSANLIGSGLGSLGSLWVLARFGGTGAVIFGAVLGFLAALLFAIARRPQILEREYKAKISIILICSGIAIWMLFSSPSFLEQNLSPYKTLSILKQAIGTQQILTTTNATSRLDLLESSAIHIMPGMSLFSLASIPPQAGLVVDGDNLMPITQLDPNSPEAQELASYLPQALPYLLRPNARVLVLDAQTGLDVFLGLASGAADVVAVEENEMITAVVHDNFSVKEGDVFSDYRVQVVNEASRVFARRSVAEGFDLVIVSLAGQHRPVQSGAYTLTEDYGTTVEATENYLQLLKKGGLLIVTRWLQTPPSESARAFATMAKALSNSGRDPKHHLAAWRSMRTMTILAAAGPLQDEELNTIRKFLDNRGFDIAFLPDVQAAELNRFNVLPEDDYYELFNNILERPQATIADYEFDIQPATDNRPFFFHFFKWRQTPEILAGFGKSWQPFGGSGFFVLVAMLILVSLAAALFIIGPLLIWKRAPAKVVPEIPYWRFRVFIYFATLGLAFLFVELPLAQQFILLFSKPVIALAVVIFTILLFSGIGSLVSKKISLTLALTILVALVAIYPFFLRWAAPILLPRPEWMRIIFSILILAPLGFFMGFPFASGLRILEGRGANLVPWAWAINGSFSVISSVLAVIVALTWGFALVLWLGAGAYGLALLAFGRL